MTTINVGASLPTGVPKPDRKHDGWKTGVAVAGLAGIASMQKSFVARPVAAQAILTAASVAIGFGAGVGADAIANGVDSATGLDGMTSRLAVAGAGAVGVLGTTLALRGRTNIGLQVARTTAGVVGGGALVGAGLIGEQRLVDGMSDRVPGGAVAGHAALLGAATVGAAGLMLGMRRPTAMAREAEAAYRSTLAGIPKVSTNYPAFDAARAASLDAQRAVMTTTSGKGVESSLPSAKLDVQGLRFLNDVTPPGEIARVMDVAPGKVTSPFRIYAGLQHAPNHKELVANTIQEAGRLRNELGKSALDSDTIFINMPSGSGYIAPPQVSAAEHLTRGNVTTLAFQYINKPSLQAVTKVPVASALLTEVMEQLVPAIRARPGGADTKIVVYSESLGSWSVQNALRGGGADTVAEHGIDLVINAGTPRFSKFRTDHLGEAGHTVDPTGRIIEFDNIRQLEALPAEARAKLNTFLFSHYDDPVTRFTPRLAVEPPPYLTRSDAATGIPPKMKWYPVVSAIQSAIDMANGVLLPLGRIGSRNHDYRGDIAPVMANLLDAPATSAQLEGIMAASSQSEVAVAAQRAAATQAKTGVAETVVKGS